MNSKLIFIEGVDRTGKGSLMQAIHKATNYKHVIFDRGVISNIAYSMIHGRITQEQLKQYENLENQLADVNHLMILLECSTEELQRRADATQHEPINFSLHKSVFRTLVAGTPLNTVTLDSTNSSPEELVKQLAELNLI